MNAWSLIIAGVGVVGLFLAGKKNLWGWAVGFASEFLWIIYGLATMQAGLSVAGLAYAVVSAKNFWAWRQEGAVRHRVALEKLERWDADAH